VFSVPSKLAFVPLGNSEYEKSCESNLGVLLLSMLRRNPLLRRVLLLLNGCTSLLRGILLPIKGSSSLLRVLLLGNALLRVSRGWSALLLRILMPLLLIGSPSSYSIEVCVAN